MNYAIAIKGMGGCTVLLRGGGRLLLRRLVIIPHSSRLQLSSCDLRFQLQPLIKSPETTAALFPNYHGTVDYQRPRRDHLRKRLPLLPRYEKSLYFSPPEGSPSSKPRQSDKPGLDELQKTYNILQTSLDRLFTHSMDYKIYHQDIVFVDNIRHLRTQGLAKYIQQVALLKTVGHLKYAYVKFEVINMSMSPEEGRITVRWRIKGLSGTRVMLKFWKFKLWKWKELINQQETWHDGISYFDVGADGRIFQHIADKMMEDKNTDIHEKERSRNIPLAAKLGGLASILPHTDMV